MRRRKELKPIYASECSKCSSCQYKNSVTSKTVYCSKLGLQIFSNDFSSPPPKNVISHLRIAGYLTATKPEYTWDDVRAAIIFPQKDNDIRSYYQYVPQKQVLPGAQYRKSLLTLNKLRNDASIRQNKEKWDSFVLSTCNPLIIKIQESFLKNRQNDSVVNDYIKKIIIPNNHEIDCKQIIKSLNDDVLLWAGIHIYLPAYQKCDCANQFLQRNHLRIPFAICRNECSYCIDNKSGFCKRLECKLIGYKEDVPETDRIHAIEIIGNNHGIDRQIIDYCKSLERSDTLSGLTKLRHILGSPQSVSVYTGAGLQDLDILPNQKISDDKAIEWVEKKIQNNCSILRIEAAIKQLYGLKKGRSIIQNVIFALKTMPSDHNELCLSDYQIDSSKNLNKLNKCITCSYATSLYCKKYNQKFALTFNTIPSEVNEILSVFNSTPLEVKLDTVQKSNTLEIEIDNPGDAISIDVRVENSIDDAKLWHETQLQKMEVEIPAAVEFENQLDIEIGETGDGMVLDDSML
ncbi:MAG: hypothetical protein GX639_01620 [Fibrobacter sp.]|nr:hypothetical protein [Fibrobacter sp.]